jgi:predicted glycoside hydrolase/deacetylase ChbG (UPF0249 family)
MPAAGTSSGADFPRVQLGGCSTLRAVGNLSVPVTIALVYHYQADLEALVTCSMNDRSDGLLFVQTRMRRPSCTIRFVIAWLLVAVGTRNAVAETWAERLGFPPNSKVLILHAQELGLCHETNSAGARLLESGAVRSAGAMPPCPWFGDVAKWSAEHPDADIGLELTLNSEWDRYRWRPVASDGEIASLLDPDRFFWRSTMQTMVNAHADDVERELLAQIAYAKSLGLRPTHLTTHLGALITRPDLIEVYLRIARQNWIPAMVVELTPEQVERFRRQGFPLPDDIIALLANYPLPKVDDLRIVAPADTYEAKKQGFLALIRELPPGLTQIALHPAAESEALKRIMPDWQQRVWDARLMGDDDVRAALSPDGVVLTDWREIMRRFQGPTPGNR